MKRLLILLLLTVSAAFADGESGSDSNSTANLSGSSAGVGGKYCVPTGGGIQICGDHVIVLGSGNRLVRIDDVPMEVKGKVVQEDEFTIYDFDSYNQFLDQLAPAFGLSDRTGFAADSSADVNLFFNATSLKLSGNGAIVGAYYFVGVDASRGPYDVYVKDALIPTNYDPTRYYDPTPWGYYLDNDMAGEYEDTSGNHNVLYDVFFKDANGNIYNGSPSSGTTEIIVTIPSGGATISVCDDAGSCYNEPTRFPVFAEGPVEKTYVAVSERFPPGQVPTVNDFSWRPVGPLIHLDGTRTFSNIIYHCVKQFFGGQPIWNCQQVPSMPPAMENALRNVKLARWVGCIPPYFLSLAYGYRDTRQVYVDIDKASLTYESLREIYYKGGSSTSLATTIFAKRFVVDSEPIDIDALNFFLDRARSLSSDLWSSSSYTIISIDGNRTTVYGGCSNSGCSALGTFTAPQDKIEALSTIRDSFAEMWSSLSNALSGSGE